MADREILSPLYLPSGMRYSPPDATEIFTPYQQIRQFWPDDQPQHTDWVQPFEEYLEPLAARVAEIFGVRLAHDPTYIQVPEDVKASSLFVVLTRAGLRQQQPGIWEWTPICIVVKYCIMALVRCRLDQANGQLKFLDLLLWANRQREYVPVVNDQTGEIQNPGIILPILARYGQMEGLIR